MSSAPSIANTLAFGSGPECPTEEFGLPGLERIYGITFGSFLVTDPGGPKTVEALRLGRIDAGVLFSTDPHLETEGIVLLEDDRHLQPPENLVPLVRGQVASGSDLHRLLWPVQMWLRTPMLVTLNRRVQIEGMPVPAAVSSWLGETGLVAAARPAGSRTPLTVGSANFAESVLVAEIWAQILEANGFVVTRRHAVGNRQAYLPLVERGAVDLVPEYLGSLLAHLRPGSVVPTDPQVAYEHLYEVVGRRRLVPLRPAFAQNQNGIVVTQSVAETHDLHRISDLARPAR